MPTQEEVERSNRDVKLVKLTFTHSNRPDIGVRVVHDAEGVAHSITNGGPPVTIEVPEKQAKHFRKISEDGSAGFVVKGAEPENADQRKIVMPDGTEHPQLSRQEIEDAERKEIEQAQSRSIERQPRGARTRSEAVGSATDRETSGTSDKLTRAELEEMNKDDLQKHADRLGAEYTTRSTKEDLVDAIVRKQRG